MHCIVSVRFVHYLLLACFVSVCFATQFVALIFVGNVCVGSFHIYSAIAGVVMFYVWCALTIPCFALACIVFVLTISIRLVFICSVLPTGSCYFVAPGCFAWCWFILLCCRSHVCLSPLFVGLHFRSLLCIFQLIVSMCVGFLNALLDFDLLLHCIDFY